MKRKVLIVDDEQQTIEHLTNILMRSDYEVLATTKGKEAYGLAKEHVPDIIILDTVIPDMMGGDIQHQLKQDTATSTIPIIFLSGLNTKEDEQIVKEKTGSYHILAKPTTAQKVLEAVQKALTS